MLIESRHLDTTPPLFVRVDGARCSRCGDLGIQIGPNGDVRTCPVIELGLAHDEPNAAAKIIDRATRSLMFRGVPVNPLAFDVARALSRRSTDDPAPRQTLLDKYFGWASHQRLRKFHYVIEDLRSVWLLPVASRKGSPHGYWIATEEDDFAAWVKRAKSAPIRQLTTIHRVAKANFPILAEQMEFEFWQDLEALPPGA